MFLLPVFYLRPFVDFIKNREILPKSFNFLMYLLSPNRLFHVLRMGLRLLFSQFSGDGCCSGIDKLVGFSQTDCAAHLFFDINYSIIIMLEEVLNSGIMLDIGGIDGLSWMGCTFTFA